MAAYADNAPDSFTRDYLAGPYPRVARPVEPVHSPEPTAGAGAKTRRAAATLVAKTKARVAPKESPATKPAAKPAAPAKRAPTLRPAQVIPNPTTGPRTVPRPVAKPAPPAKPSAPPRPVQAPLSSAGQVQSFVPLGVPLDAPLRQVRAPYALPAGIRRRSRDVGGSILLLVAAAVGLFAWFGPWSSIVGSVTGRTVFLAMRNFREQSHWALAIQVVLIASIVIATLGVGLLVKSYVRRYIGFLALLAALATIVAELYLVIQAGFDFDNTWLGYWAFLATGFLMLVGAVKTMGAPR